MHVHHDCAGAPRHRHVVQFYRGDRDLADRVAAYLAVSLLARQRAALVATGPHARAIQDQLAARGLQVTLLRSSGLLLVVDADEVYAQVAPPGRIDAEAFRRVVVRPVDLPVRGTGEPIRVYGEIVDLLARDHRMADAIQIERMWDDLIATHDLELMCGYAAEHIAALARESAFRQVCVAHRDESAALLADDPRNATDTVVSMSLMRQQIVALEAEVQDRRALDQAMRRMQAEVAQARHLEATANLAGGIAHHYNNLLCVIEGYAALLGESLADEPALSAQVREIADAAERASALTRQLMTFTQPHATNGRTALDEALRGMWPLVRHRTPENVGLELETGADDAFIGLDPGQLDQVMAALLENARLAVGAAGTIVVRTSMDDEDGNVALSVEDSGAGMDEGVRQRAVEPFFTTRGLAVASGLGLSTVHGLVTAAGGRVELDSAPGKGTRVRLVLPVVSIPARPLKLVLEQPPVSDDAVLVVEDDPAVRRLVTASLRKSGFPVLEASGGGQALALAQEHQGPIGLVLSDVLLPDMDGPALVRRVRALRPGASVLFMSGHTETQSEPLDAPLIAKPFTSRALIQAVQGELDRAGRRTDKRPA